MGFILATGTDNSEGPLGSLVSGTGFGDVVTQSGPGWAFACDTMSTIGQPSEQSKYLVLLEGYLADTGTVSQTVRPTSAGPKINPASLVADLLTEHGPAALENLSGCFALLAVDLKSGTLISTRDRCGGRTLYFHQGDGRTIIATRSAWVVRAARLKPEPNPSFIVSQMALQGSPQPGESAFKAVTELMPGEILTVTGKQGIIRRPQLVFDNDFDYRHAGDCVARFLELLNQAVAACLPDTGDVACMLSGGLDSGPVAVLADRQLARRDQQLFITSWSLRDYPDADEEQWIRETAAVLREPARLVDGSSWLPFDRLDDSVLCPDLPHYNGFRALINNCYQRAGELGCKVILNGNAGDQLYAPLHRLNIDRLRRHQWAPLWHHIVRLWHQGRSRRLLSDSALRHPVAQIVRFGRSSRRPPAWLTPLGQNQWQPSPAWPPEADSQPHPEYARQLFGVRMAFGRAHETEIPNRHGVDRRDPFHNEALIRFMHNAPFELSWKGGASKSIMRRAMRDLLPDSIRHKPRTGLLSTFFRAGLNENRTRIEKLLFREQTGWQAYVRADVIRSQLDGSSTGPEALISACVGHALWHDYWERQLNFD